MQVIERSAAIRHAGPQIQSVASLNKLHQDGLFSDIPKPKIILNQMAGWLHAINTSDHHKKIDTCHLSVSFFFSICFINYCVLEILLHSSSRHF